MSRPGTILTNQLLARFGSQPDMRIWRNPVAHAWIGKYEGRTREGDTVLSNARIIQVGLVEGASDIVGVAPGGLFLAAEVKAGNDRSSKAQRTFIEVVDALGGVAGIVRGPEDMEKLIARARERAG